MEVVNVIKYKINTFKVYSLSIIVLLCFSVNVWAKDVIKISTSRDFDNSYWREILTTGLDLSSEEFGAYEIVTYEYFMKNERHVQEMKKGELVNAWTAVTTAERESEFIPIKIPIHMGLLNYRLLLANKSDLSKFEGIETAEQLAKLKVGLIDTWVTSDILHHHNFNLLRISDFDSLMIMLMAKRYDYTVRGVNEIYSELAFALPEGTDFAIVPNIGVYINSPFYVFISKRHPRLARRIEVGFELMLENGQFQQIFYKWHQKNIDRANLNTRKFINIDNPLLPTNTPTDRTVLWFKAHVD